MKDSFYKMALLIAISSLGFLETSCNKTKPTTNELLTNDAAERQVLETDDRRIKALRENDPKPLREIYADDYTLVTPSGVVRSKEEQIQDLESGRVKYQNIETTERSVRIYDDVAIVLSRDTYDILQGGQQVGGDIYFTRTYKRFGNDWRVIATHGCFVKSST